MAKRGNPLFKATSPVVEVVDPNADDIVPLNESFPGVPPMSVREKKRLAELEEIVTRNFKAFYEVGCALREIQTSMLYRETHTNFADYAKDLWDLARSRAYQMIEAADIIDRLLPNAPEMSTDGGQTRTIEVKNVQNFGQNKILPQNDSQARALAKYPEDKQIEIWRKAVETADGRITAAHIKRTARQLHGEKVEKAVRKARKEINEPTSKMSDRFRAAFNEMLDAINEERLADWKHTDPNEAQRYIKALWQAVVEPL